MSQPATRNDVFLMAFTTIVVVVAVAFALIVIISSLR